jgi:hypothetical protein
MYPLTLHLRVQRKLTAFSPRKVMHHAVFCKYYAELAKKLYVYCVKFARTEQLHKLTIHCTISTLYILICIYQAFIFKRAATTTNLQISINQNTKICVFRRKTSEDLSFYCDKPDIFIIEDKKNHIIPPTGIYFQEVFRKIIIFSYCWSSC